ncbi:reticulon-1 isoform X1 [Coccinella septempunctata]|uniref:reticulon-1 isoform X1 n=1 Tax=Coccinella septempunctata TaxID=41139 RepID=UPI001D05E551|nr:reticulon-1 isoform X1 [Coccinella septempunctata]
MENKNEFLEAGDGFVKESHIGAPLQREHDSVDDFEHLGHESLVQKEIDHNSPTVKKELSDLLIGHTGDLHEIINKGVDSAHKDGIENVSAAQSFSSELDEDFGRREGSVMESNLISTVDDFPSSYEGKEKLDQYLQGAAFGDIKNFLSDSKNNDVLSHPNIKSATYDFMEAEKGIQETISSKAEEFEDKSPKHGDLLKDKVEKESFSSLENLLADDFKDVTEDFEQHVSPSKDEKKPKKEPEPVSKGPSNLVSNLVFEDATSEKVLPEIQPKETKEKAEKTTLVKESPAPSEKLQKPTNVIEAEVFFCKMGLDTWFNPEKLNPKVESLIYWRDPKKSGPVFGGVLLVLLALTYFSLISVIAYLSLLGLTGTISFRVYKNVVQAVQKTGEGHPFKEFLEFDLSLPPEKVKEISEVVVAHVNAGLSALRRLFLVEDLIDSIKFGVFMWTLTYVGSWFNGMTLVILAWVALFTLPKVYETNKTQIDANLEFVKSKLAEVTSKVRAAVPLGKKEEKKD